jgi:ABC-2 type transport system ATP-binding protein
LAEEPAVEVRDEGRTVVLTTHYMEEARTLCDRVAIMDAGKMIACDTLLNLIRSLEANATVLVTVEGELNGGEASLPGVAGFRREGPELRLRTRDSQATLLALMRLAEASGARVSGLLPVAVFATLGSLAFLSLGFFLAGISVRSRAPTPWRTSWPSRCSF